MAALAILLILAVRSKIMKAHSRRRKLTDLFSKADYNITIATYFEDPVNYT